jgi:hypothetical protein
MTDVVKDLEAYLDVGTEKGDFEPGPEHLSVLEEAHSSYYAAPMGGVRRRVATGFAFVCALTFLLGVLTSAPALAGLAVGLALMTPAFACFLDSLFAHTALFRRLRGLLFGMSPKGWWSLAACVAVGVGVLVALGWLPVALAAIVMAALYQWQVGGRLRTQRDSSLELMRGALRGLRLRGLSEEAIQDFVARYTGPRWEEFFEDLFGYKNMLLARGKWSVDDLGRSREQIGRWRDPVASWIADIEQARKSAHHKRTLANAEARRLAAAGVTESQARTRAELEASRFIAEDLAFRIQSMEAMAGSKASRRPRGRDKGFPGQALFCHVRVLVALVIVAAWAVQHVATLGMELPKSLIAFAQDRYYGWGVGGEIYGLIAGIALLATAFSRLLLAPLFVLTGVLLAIACEPITRLVAQPAFTPTAASVLGAALVAAGFLLSALRR